MTAYEYQVLPAPERGKKAKGLKTPQARFAFALQELMNTMASEGWEFQRAETLPSVERAGLTSTATHYRNVLVFRRHRADALANPSPALLQNLIGHEAPEIEQEIPDEIPDDTPIEMPNAESERPS